MANRSIVDLGSTVQKNKDTPNAILVMHALSGDDTVTTTYNVGKELAPKPLKQPPQKSCPSLGMFKPILMQLRNMDAKRLRASVQFACLASSIVYCFVPMKLAHRVSSN